MRVVLIGAGRLATHFGKALHRAGHDIVAVYSRQRAHAEALCQVVGGVPADRFEALPMQADVFVVSLTDQALQQHVAQFTKGREGQLFVHTAGSVPMDVFQGYVQRYGVCYPMQTFSKEREVDFAEIPVFIEGGDPVIRRLAESVSGRVYELSSADRQYLHLAAVFACNFANHCYALSADILNSHGVPFDVMLPLIDETARKIHELSPLDAQTGPAVRYDTNVIDKHLSLLASMPEAREVYSLLSESIHNTQTTNS